MDYRHFASIDASNLATFAAIELARRKDEKSIGYEKVKELSDLMDEAIKRNDVAINSILYQTSLDMKEKLKTTEDLRKYVSSLTEEMRNADNSSNDKLEYMINFNVLLSRNIRIKTPQFRRPDPYKSPFKRYVA